MHFKVDLKSKHDVPTAIPRDRYAVLNIDPLIILHNTNFFNICIKIKC